ncbi:alpha/beta hydrolase [Ornithinibacillus gellani]|uniref:esterase/lipase family protein n=1 Tax=Ornithinibacillus gellani TaxID=2293253 RepID=UPI000F4A2B85|nr:alpha/beta fold hydrolase [Ornithinibacillus gellani]TQS74918.1 alpha/beta hydrolase [Ornithinibacillus gellani]
MRSCQKWLILPAFLLLFILPMNIHADTMLTENKEQVAAQPTVVGKGKAGLYGKGGNGNDETPGEWYAGDTPPNLLPNAPILLFVPGLNNVAQIWWEENNMYQTAFDAGYQTAFVQLHDAGGESADMWDNGELLAEKINEIAAHFDHQPITIIAYSKGGVDTQTALTYFGVQDKVDQVITLSSPHHGSQLADLAYSFWAGWLADLIGMQGDGTYAMETGYMAHFRSITDPEPLASYHHYYTLGGTDWGSAFSSNWFGGMYLSSYGPNDGVVTTDSSKLPGAQELAIGDWNHTSIRTGVTFPVFENYLSSANVQKQASQRIIPVDTIEKNNHHANRWIHGGPLEITGMHEIEIPIEDQVQETKLQIMSAKPLTDFQLVNEDGQEVPVTVTSGQEMEGYFPNAYIYQVNIQQPASDELKLRFHSEKENAYLLVADYQAANQLSVKRATTLLGPMSGGIQYELKPESSGFDMDKWNVTYHVMESGNPASIKTWTMNGKAGLTKHLTLAKEEEVYNITIDIEGKTTSGSTFKRTYIDTIYTGK